LVIAWGELFANAISWRFLSGCFVLAASVWSQRFAALIYNITPRHDTYAGNFSSSSDGRPLHAMRLGCSWADGVGGA
jgi:hypothetical protein